MPRICSCVVVLGYCVLVLLPVQMCFACCQRMRQTTNSRCEANLSLVPPSFVPLLVYALCGHGQVVVVHAVSIHTILIADQRSSFCFPPSQKHEIRASTLESGEGNTMMTGTVLPPIKTCTLRYPPTLPLLPTSLPYSPTTLFPHNRVRVAEALKSSNRSRYLLGNVYYYHDRT